jgi:hypothetical protein
MVVGTVRTVRSADLQVRVPSLTLTSTLSLTSLLTLTRS